MEYDIKFRRQFLAVLTFISVSASGLAWGQVPYDPTLAARPAPNVMILIDATRTTLINGETCHGKCHATGGHGHLDDYNMYGRGETRLQLARRVLTGGWGWNSNANVANSDARISTDGIMDTYRGYRWGVSWYDGSGVRLALDPTTDNERAQKTVIDFSQPCFEVRPNSSGTCVYGLNSWMPAVGSAQGSFSTSDGRQSHALQYIEQYWDPNVNAPQTSAKRQNKSGKAYGSPTLWIPGGIDPNDENVIDQDTSNVLVNPPTGLATGGCRRNFTILLTDGHGGSSWNGIGNGEAAGRIYNMQGAGGVDLSSVPITQADGTVINEEFSNQVFSIWFGTADKPNADRIADHGWDGKAGGGVNSITQAFEGAPGGVISDLSVLKAAFTQVMDLLADGNYIGATPSISRFGEHIVYSTFTIPNCVGVPPGKCNFGRPGDIYWIKLNDQGEQTPLPGQPGAHNESVSAGANLEMLAHHERRLLTAYPEGIGSNGSNAPPTELNCGSYAGGSGDRCGGNDVSMMNIPTPHSAGIAPSSYNSAITNGSPGALARFRNLNLKYNDIAYLAGDPVSRLEGGPYRGDWECSTSNPSTCCPDNLASTSNPRAHSCLDRHFKIADIANSRPVIVSAPSGIAEDLPRWRHFLQTTIPRTGSGLSAPLGGSNNQLVGDRDRVVYVGGNDGFLHAFLVGEASGNFDTDNNVSIDYQRIGASCNSSNRQRCHGQEIWSYSPGMLQESWGFLKAGHFYMIDGSPVVSDVLFTKGDFSPETNASNFCNRHSSSACNDWEYRTVLMQCLGIGGPGCFAMDVTNPYNPQLLWEREFTRLRNTGGNVSLAPTARVTTTSRPQIHRVRRMDGQGRSIPYYVGIMGGGMQETQIGTNPVRSGTLLVVGLEDGAYWHSPANQLADADFAGTPTCIDADGDSYIDTCYILTTQADIYKVRFTNSDPSQGMTMVKFFDGRLAADQIHSDASNSILSYTKLVAAFDELGRLSLFFTTGNYEDIQDVSEQNYVFKVFDVNPRVMPSAPVSRQENLDRMNGACRPNLDSNIFGGENARGTHGILRLPPGEKVVFDPVLGGGSLLFTTYLPDANSCGIGEGKIYGIYYRDCTQGLDTDTQDGLDSYVNRPGNATSANGQLTGVAHDAESGTIQVGFNNPANAASGNLAVSNTKKQTQEKKEIPLIKLWWRQIMP